MSFSSLLGSIVENGIQDGWNSAAQPATSNMGVFLYNLAKFFRDMATSLKAFFTASVTIGGQDISVWVLFSGGAIVTVLILILVQKITPIL